MHMDLVIRNAEIVALVKARKMPMRKIAARYRLSTSSISLIAIRHGVHAQSPDPKKVRAASKLIQRGMPLRHVAQTVGLNYQGLRQLLAEQGVYKVPPPNRLWSERELRILRRDYGKPGRGPKGMQADVVQKLHDAFKRAIEDKSVIEMMAKYDMVPRYLDMIAYRRAVEVSIESDRPTLEKLGLARKD